MSDRDKEKTALVTPDGFEMNVMPFRLSNTLTWFERMMDTAFRGLRWKLFVCYLDEVVVFSTSFSEHLDRLRTTFWWLFPAGLQRNHKEYHFEHKKIQVLRQVASPDGVSPDPDEVKAASEFPVPQTTPHLRSFVCPNSYFHRFIRGFATISALLTSLLRKDTPFKLTQDCANDFAKLKQVLTSSPTLRHYDPDTTAELYLQTPAETALEQFSISEVKMNRCNTLLPIQTELSQKKKKLLDD